MFNVTAHNGAPPKPVSSPQYAQMGLLVQLIEIGLRKRCMTVSEKRLGGRGRAVICPWKFFGEDLLWPTVILKCIRISAQAKVKEIGLGVTSVITVTCLAQVFASSLKVVYWWHGTDNRMSLSARLSSMRITSEVLVEPHSVVWRSNGLSARKVAAFLAGRSHASAIHITAFSSTYGEVSAAPHRFIVGIIMGLAGFPSVTTYTNSVPDWHYLYIVVVG